MKNYIAYHGESIMGYPFKSPTDGWCNFLSNKKLWHLDTVVGNKVWIISSSRMGSTLNTYFFRGYFVPSRVKEWNKDGYEFWIGGQEYFLAAKPIGIGL